MQGFHLLDPLTTADDINHMSKKEFEETLPTLLKEVLSNHSGLKENINDKEPTPSSSHTLLLEKEESEEKISEAEWTTIVSKDVRKTLKTAPVHKAGPMAYRELPGFTSSLSRIQTNRASVVSVKRSAQKSFSSCLRMFSAR